MGASFGAPVPVGQAGAVDPSKAALPSNEPQEVVDENDPRLISETLEVNMEADAYAQPVPPPDAKYRVKLKLEGVKIEGSQDKKDYTTGLGKDKVPFYKTNISGTIIDPSGRFDGITLYPQFGGGISTAKRKNGATQVTTLLSRIKKADGTPWAQTNTRLSQLEWIQLLVKALNTEPEVGVETMWEASCQKCGEELKPKGEYATRTSGMYHFPMEQDATKKKLCPYSPDLPCKVNPAHGYARARAIIASFLHLHELK